MRDKVHKGSLPVLAVLLFNLVQRIDEAIGEELLEVSPVPKANAMGRAVKVRMRTVPNRQLSRRLAQRSSSTSAACGEPARRSASAARRRFGSCSGTFWSSRGSRRAHAAERASRPTSR